MKIARIPKRAILLFLTVVILIPTMENCRSHQVLAAQRQAERVQRNHIREEEKIHRAELKQHWKMQDKETRKRMKKSKRKARKMNRRLRYEFFLWRWLGF
ncbi:MAG: hypothetical protein JW861_07210 [Bacteroidales bacterium]|nr:hypothetical protein [Bacteroidales bacterium]